jgi:hypothetical protein
MGIEVRNGRAFFYSKLRVGDRVRSIYRGPAGDSAAPPGKGRPEPADKPVGWEMLAEEVGTLAKRAKVFSAVAMEAVGYRRHKRGAWRLRRNRKGTQMSIDAGETPKQAAMTDASTARPVPTAGPVVTDRPSAGTPAPALPPADAWAKMTEHSFNTLVGRIDRGDPLALPEVRKLLSADAIRAIELLGGNLARSVEEAVVVKFHGSQPAKIELVLAQLERLRCELTPPGAPALERLAAQEAVAGWLLVQALDLACIADEPGREKRLEALRKERARAHKQYQSALRTLAVVTRRPSPAVQVNVAQAKVTIAEANVMAGR